MPFRTWARVAALTLSIGIYGCQNGVIGDGPPQDWLPSLVNAPHVADGPVTVTLTETSDAVVLHVPLAALDQADDIARQMSELLGSISVPTWGSGDSGFGVPWIDWRGAVPALLDDAIRGGTGGWAQMLAKAIHGVRPELLATQADLAPAAAGDSVGALPIVVVYPGEAGLGEQEGVWIDVRLQSQLATCPTCPFTDPSTVKRTRVTLLTSGEVQALEGASQWSGGVNCVIAKSAVWWAPSGDGQVRLRNWMMLIADGGDGLEVRCLTPTGVWP